MAEVRETHVWFDGACWHVYTERPADARRFTRILGPADPRSHGAKGEREVWWWRDRPRDSLRVNAKRRVSESQVARARDLGRSLQKLRAGRDS